VTAGDHTGDGGRWRPPDDDPPAATDAPEGERASTPPPTEEPPPPPPPPAARRTVAPGPVEEKAGRSISGKLVLAVVVAVLVIAIPVGLAIVASLSGTGTADDATAPEAGAPDDPEDPDDPAGPDDGPLADEDLAADLDLEALSGRDEAFGRLLAQVDASERAMIGFQNEVAEVLEDHAGTDPGELMDQLRAAAREGGAGLSEVRPGLVTETGYPAADEVRSVYLTHHDVWADYLDAVAEDPTLLGSEDEGARWTLSINASAEAFERALREELDGDLDDDVRELGEEILARGFDRGDVRPDA
jgi:hypothetical protein